MFHRGSWKPSEALWARTGPGSPKRAPQMLLEAIWGSIGPNRAGKPQTGSTEPPGSHLGPYRPEPGQEAPNGLYGAS